MLEGEWSSLSEMYNNEESNFMPQLMTSSFLPNDHFSACPESGHALNSWQGGYESSTMDMGYGYEEGLLHFSDSANSNYYFSRGSGYESCYYPQVLAMNPDESMTNFFSGSEEVIGMSMQTSEGDNVVEGVDCLINKAMIDDCNVVEESNKKRPLSSKVPKNKRNVKPRKNLKHVSPENNHHHEDEEEEEESIARTIKRQGSSSCSSEENSTVASQELKTKALNSSGKTRASRGSATDPQSLYARKRRERINERLRILQSLVPNGTKVDISTMLEEAVQYVNFLKLQIKLLSSDDLWMYAPLAYNGMDIGLDLKINMLNELKRG